MRATWRWVAGGAIAAAGAYAATVAFTRAVYGRPCSPAPDEVDTLLDRFIPAPEVVERHHIDVSAPVDATFDAFSNVVITDSRIAAAIFKLRELS